MDLLSYVANQHVFTPSALSVSDVLSILTFLTVIIGGIFGFHKWRKDVNLKRAEYINVLTEKIRSDDAIKETLYDFDYDLSWYGKNFHNSGEKELKVDKTLSFFSYICYLRKKRIITKKEFAFFEYETNRTIQNNQVQDYLYNLYHFARKFNTPVTFYYLVQYGLDNGLLDDDFCDSSVCERNHPVFHKNLNF